MLSNQIRGIVEVFQPDKVLLDAPRTNKAIEDTDATGLVVGATSSGATERLLADNCSRALFVVIDVTSRIAETVCGGK